jgi:hypothetical protein
MLLLFFFLNGPEDVTGLGDLREVDLLPYLRRAGSIPGGSGS